MATLRTIGSLALGCALAYLIGGCATTKPAEPAAALAPAPNVRLGAPLELLKVRTVRDKVRAIAGADGQVHVLIASTELRQVLEVTVAPGGQVERRVIQADVSPSRVDAAFDAAGTLHALIDTGHLVFKDGAWTKSDRTPWQELGIKAHSARFVPGAPDLVWAFQVSGRDLGAPGRVEIFGLGGYGGALIWPWLTRGLRTVLVADSAAKPATDPGTQPGEIRHTWVVVEPQGREDTAPIDLAADPAGNVQLVYARSRGGLASEVARRYARLGADLLRGSPASASGLSEARLGSTRLLGIEGQPIGPRLLVRSESATGPVLVPQPAGLDFRLAACDGAPLCAETIGAARDPWLGKGFPVRYAVYSGNAWSVPVDVGLADAGSFWGYIWDALDIASTGQGRSLLVWPTEQGIVGRWVERLP